MKGLRAGLAILSYLLLSTGWVQAGAWTAPRGHGYFKVNYQYQSSTRQFDLEGNLTDYEFGGQSIAHFLFVEGTFGFAQHWQLRVMVPIALDVQFNQPAGDARGQGVGEFWVLAQRQLNTGVWVNTLESGFKIPLRDGSGSQDLSKIVVTQGQLDWLIRWSTGFSFWPAPGYIQAELGYLVRSANTTEAIEFQPGDEIWYRLDGGYRVWTDLMMGLSLDGIAGSNGTSTSLETELANSAQSYTRIAPWLMLDVSKNVKIEARYYHHFQGQNYPAGDIWTASVFMYY
jgi:hypothetical protein